MRTKKIKKMLATAVAISTTATIIPAAQIVMASTTNSSNIIDSVTMNEPVDKNNDTEYYSEQMQDVHSTVTSGAAVSTTSSAVYYNDFEDEKLPDQVNWSTDVSSVAVEDLGGDKALGFDVNYGGVSEWDAEKALSFWTSSTETIKADSVIQFDVLIPEAKKDFNGEIKFGGLLQDKDWTDEGDGYGSVSASDFIDEGNGYLRKTVSVKTSKDTEGLKNVVTKIAGYKCNYAGKIYIDNINVSKAKDSTDVLPDVGDLEWKFDDSTKDLDGWAYNGGYQYSGSTENVVNYDSSVGGGSIKLDVDYSKDSAISWSEFKISKTLDEETSFNGYNILTYDFVYDPAKMTSGGFQTKLFITNSLNTYGLIDLSNATDAGNGLKKAQVALKFTSQDVNAGSITIGIIGSNTDYKGNLYIDNIRLSQEQVADKYVKLTATTTPQDKVEPKDLSIDPTVKLVDSSATDKTASLYAYLKGVGKSEYVLYGHQNDTHHKAGHKDTDNTNSDTKDITGSTSAIIGSDALSLTGAELQLTDADKTNGLDLITKAANLGIDASNEGGIITLSAHMPNFEAVKEKGKDSNGNYDYSGYTPGVTSGNVVSRIMPDGDLNDVYVGYLDLLAKYAHKLESAGVPVLFRPFHENNGSWFWWGKAFCDEEAYKNVYRYTVEYLRDTKNVHNFLYVYSPNGPFEGEKDYLSRYPGDQFVDILAFDMYDDNPTADAATDPWMKDFKATIDLIQGIANKSGKLSAVSETGIRVSNDALGVSGNVDKTWFSEISNIISASNMPYYMVWANFGETSGFYSPYMVSDTKGHEMINDFIDYYNDSKSVFADGVGDYSAANVGKDSAYSYGFITSPASNNRILAPTTIKASLKGYSDPIKFVLKNKAGESIESLNATLSNGVYSAEITQAALDKIGQTIGSIELYSGDTKLNTITAIFNIKEAVKNPKVVDDFESYSGEDALLQNNWSTNAGPGCSVTPKLDKDNRNGGTDGLAFNYKISTEKTPEGWAGIVKTVDADWSDCDALQFWCRPDGNGQKLVIQVTSNGEDFEVKMPEFAGTKEPKLVTLKFSDFVGKKGGTIDLSKIGKMGIWCNTIVPTGHTGAWNVDSTMYFDDIKAINTSKVNNTSDNNSGNANGQTSNNNPTSGSTTNSSNHHSSTSTTSNDKTTTSNNSTDSGTSTSQGEIKNNWVLEDGKWYYADENGAKVSNAWKSINGQWYYLNSDGTMKTGWLKDKDNNWYYLESNGSMKTGWLLDKDNKWYYMQSNGSMKTGWIKDTDGNWYYLKEDGAMASNEYVNGYWVGKNGAWGAQ